MPELDGGGEREHKHTHSEFRTGNTKNQNLSFAPFFRKRNDDASGAAQSAMTNQDHNSVDR